MSIDAARVTEHTGLPAQQQTAKPTADLPYHAQPLATCLDILKSAMNGLSNEEAKQRLTTHLKEAASTGRRRPSQIFLGKLQTWASLLFVAVACLSFVNGKISDGILVFAALLVNVGIQGLIDWKSLQVEKKIVPQAEEYCTVRREGKNLTVHVNELVPGDILVLSVGQLVPADARLLSGTQLQMDESALTGESVLVPKNANRVLPPAEDVTAQENMIFAGTQVKTGQGEAVITALGNDTIMGKITDLAENTQKRQSRLTHQIETFSWRLFWISMAAIAVVVGCGIYQHTPFSEWLQLGLVLGIMAFPKTAPAFTSLIISLGIAQLKDHKIFVKKYQALETLGQVEIICTDKTGTLTENYLLLNRMFLPELGAVAYDPAWQNGWQDENAPGTSIQEMLRVGRLNNGTMVEGLRSALMGDPIDVALHRAAPSLLERGYRQRMHIPFDPATLRSATVCETPSGKQISMIKGAPESVLEVCKFYMRPDGTLAEITLSQRSEFLMLNRELAYEHNLRVVGFAQKPLLDEDESGPYNQAIFLGWMCLVDPAKAGVKETIHALRAKGIQLVMITGDQKATAEITAKTLGLMNKNSDEVWLRSDLENWEQENSKIPHHVKVFARTKPEEKLAIVSAYQKNGQIVAMVGDGVNDSPALQKSDVSIAMGLQGSQTAKASADIILMNDNLEGIITAIGQSRWLNLKIQACLNYLLSCNLGLILFVPASALLHWGLQLSVVQILWLNLLVVSLPAFMLALDPSTQESEAPNLAASKNSNCQAQPQFSCLLYWAALTVLSGLLCQGIFHFLLHAPEKTCTTAIFSTLAFSLTLNLFSVQHLSNGQHQKDFIQRLLSTPITWLVLGSVLLLQSLATYVPFLHPVLNTVALSPWEFLICMGLSTFILALAWRFQKT